MCSSLQNLFFFCSVDSQKNEKNTHTHKHINTHTNTHYNMCLQLQMLINTVILYNTISLSCHEQVCLSGLRFELSKRSPLKHTCS